MLYNLRKFLQFCKSVGVFVLLAPQHCGTASAHTVGGSGMMTFQEVLPCGSSLPLHYFVLLTPQHCGTARSPHHNRGAPVFHRLLLWRTLHRSITISGVFPKAEISQRGRHVRVPARGMYFREPHGASLDRRRSV
jgi:hypothetical protein